MAVGEGSPHDIAANKIAKRFLLLPSLRWCSGSVVSHVTAFAAIPWQLNAKELLNHVAWSAAAELTHRAADQRQRRRQARVSALKRGQA